MLQIWLIGALVWNSIVFILYVLDKRRAVRGQWRISEKTLLLVTLACGGFGALLAANYCHHKTRKWYFVLALVFGNVAWLVSYLYD